METIDCMGALRAVTDECSVANLRQVKTKGSRRISFEQFLTALAMVADTKKASLETIVTQVRARPPRCPLPRPCARKYVESMSTPKTSIPQSYIM